MGKGSLVGGPVIGSLNSRSCSYERLESADNVEEVGFEENRGGADRRPL
jgi:hypothetical protein